MKKTKKEMFAEIKEVVADNAEMVEFIDHEIALLSRKSTKSGKPSKLQIANEGIKARILEAMEYEKPYTVSDLVKVIPDEETGDLYSTSKISALVRQLKESGAVVRTVEKNRAYFTKA